MFGVTAPKCSWRHRCGSGGWADTVAVEALSLDQLDVVARANQRAAVAGKRHDRECSEYGVDRAALEAELAEVRSCQECAGLVQEVPG